MTFAKCTQCPTSPNPMLPLTKKCEKFVTSNVSKVLCSDSPLIDYTIEMGEKEKNV